LSISTGVIASGRLWTCDGCCDSWAAGADCSNGSSCGTVFEADAQFGEAGMQVFEGGEEFFFGIEDGDAALGGALAVQVENHVLAFHLFEDGVELHIVDYAGRRVCCYA